MDKSTTIAWLRSLTPEEERLLRSDSALHEFAQGSIVFAPAARPESVYVVERGLVRIFRVDASGGETTFGYVGPGGVFGELAAFGDLPRESFAAAALPATVRKFTRGTFERLVRARSDRAYEVTRQIGSRLKRIESRVEHLVFHDVRSRLVTILLELAGDFGRSDGRRVVLELPLTQSELATLIGATRQTVNATLAELRQEGLVQREGGRLVVVDRDALRKSLERA